MAASSTAAIGIGRMSRLASRGVVAASIAPRTGTEVGRLTWVFSRNPHRRYLTTAQRAAIAADLASLKPGAKPANLPIWLSQAEAAAMLKESPRSLRTVSGIKEASPALHELIKAGRLSTNLAQRIVGLPGGERKKFVELIKSGDVKGAKAKLKARLASRSGSHHPAMPTGRDMMTAAEGIATTLDWRSAFHSCWGEQKTRGS